MQFWCRFFRLSPKLYFGAFNSKLKENYKPCDCPSCTSVTLSLSEKKFKDLFKIAEKAFKKLFESGKYNPKEILKTREYKNLIEATNSILSSTITKEVPEELKKYLEESSFEFSALKTHAQLAEAKSYLKDENGNIVPYYKFEQQILNLNENYNRNYLEAEYLFATQSAQSAANWSNLEEDTERYWVEYRTAQDDRVRESHKQLANIILPKTDPFWSAYYPPNGWRCRCTAVEVLAKNKTKSNSENAIEIGEKATTSIGKSGKNTLEMFRFNPGKDKVLFPPKHSYTKIVGADKVKEVIEENRFTPKGIDKYEKALGVKIDDSIFTYLSKETRFTNLNLDVNIKSTGAYYHPIDNYVKIPIDARRKASKWYSKAVMYHEFGHAADFHNDFKNLDIVTDLMSKYRKEFAKNKNERFIEIDKKLIRLNTKAIVDKNSDNIEKVGAAADTLMSLNSNFGSGHTKAYFKNKGMSEAEFLAHAFENRFAGNELFKEVMPELYEDMIKLVEELKTKVKQHDQ